MKIDKKTIQQLVILVIIIVAIVGVMVYRSVSTHKNTAANSTVPSINTTFDQAALPELESRSSNYPDVSPSSSDQGKTNPFGQ